MKTLLFKSALLFAALCVAYGLGTLKNNAPRVSDVGADRYRQDWQQCQTERKEDQKHYANRLLLCYLNHGEVKHHRKDKR